MIKKLLICVFSFFVCVGGVDAVNTQIKVVVFDFGGVVAHVNEGSVKEFLMNSFDLSKGELSTALIEMRAFRTAGGSETLFWEKFATAQGKKLPSDWFEQYESVFRAAFTEIPETINLVKRLQKQGYQTAMLSDVTQYQAKIIQKMGYYDLFHPVLLSWETGVKKPDPWSFKILLERLNVPASAVLFVDDRIKNVQAAQNQGIDSIQFMTPDQFQNELNKRGFD